MLDRTEEPDRTRSFRARPKCQFVSGSTFGRHSSLDIFWLKDESLERFRLVHSTAAMVLLHGGGDDGAVFDATIASLIGSTHSRSGLRVRSELDRGAYPSGVTITDAQLATVQLERHRFHGDWNYTIHPITTR